MADRRGQGFRSLRTRQAALEKRLGRALSEDELLELARSLDETFDFVSSRLAPVAPVSASSPPLHAAERVGIRATALFRQLEAGLRSKFRREPARRRSSPRSKSRSRVERLQLQRCGPRTEFLSPTSQTAAFLHEDESRVDELAQRTGYSVEGEGLRGFYSSCGAASGGGRARAAAASSTHRSRRVRRLDVGGITSTLPAVEAARQAVLELGQHLEALAEKEKRHYKPRAPRTRLQRKFSQLVDDVAVQVHEALADERVGPQLLPFQRRSTRH